MGYNPGQLQTSNGIGAEDTKLTDKTIDKTAPVPLYYQLKELLLEHIKESEVGMAIPPEMELCERFGISRPTVRQAIQELVIEGYLERQKGRGTFVSRPKINQDFLITLESFNDEMGQKGLRPATKVLEFEEAACDKRVAEKLQIPIGTRVVKLRRLRSIDGEPLVLVLTFLPASFVPSILYEDMETSSLYRVLETVYGYRMQRIVRTLEARLAGEYESHLLHIKRGAPIQYIESVVYINDNAPIEFSTAYYRGDRNKFTFELIKSQKLTGGLKSENQLR